jgi:hypothetical protein
MQNQPTLIPAPRLLLLALCCILLLPAAWADSCTTEGQMTATQRDDVSRVAKLLVSDVQNGDMQGLRNDTLPAVANDFTGIANSANALKPQIQQAGITVDAIFLFDASQANAQGNQFFCTPSGSTMTIVLNFSGLPPGKYALAILHATGVQKPQQISLILSQDQGGQWKLAGFFSKPMMLADHNGVWYWAHARQYQQQKDEWAAHFYYQIASFLVIPADFITSPNVDKLRREASEVHPQNLPADQPVTIQANGQPYQISKVDFTADLGPLDCVIHYNPSPQQAADLRNPVQARQQVVNLMKSILTMHPGLRTAFHGLWVYADSNGATLFALELPMDQIMPGGPPNSVGE